MSAEIATNEYVNDLELNVNAKSASLSATDSSLVLPKCCSGQESNSDNTTITGVNVSKIEITSIPNGFTVKNDLLVLKAGDIIASGTTLTVTLTDTTTAPATLSGNMRITATASDHSQFVTPAFKDISLRGVVDPKTPFINKDPEFCYIE